MLPSVCAFERSSEMLCALLVWPIRDTRIIIYMAFWIVIRNESCAFGCYSKHFCCLGPLISEFSFSYSVLSCQQFSIWTTRSLGPSTITAVCVMMMVQGGYTECLSLVYILNLICIWYTTLLGYWNLSARLFMLWCEMAFMASDLTWYDTNCVHLLVYVRILPSSQVWNCTTNQIVFLILNVLSSTDWSRVHAFEKILDAWQMNCEEFHFASEIIIAQRNLCYCCFCCELKASTVNIRKCAYN